MAKPKTNVEPKITDASEALGTPEVKKDSVIFVGTGVVWGGKLNGNKPVATFNKNYLFETSDKKEIDILRKLEYSEITVDELEKALMTDKPFDYINKVYIKKGKLTPQTPGTYTPEQVLARNKE